MNGTTELDAIYTEAVLSGDPGFAEWVTEAWVPGYTVSEMRDAYQAQVPAAAYRMLRTDPARLTNTETIRAAKNRMLFCADTVSWSEVIGVARENGIDVRDLIREDFASDRDLRVYVNNRVAGMPHDQAVRERDGFAAYRFVTGNQHRTWPAANPSTRHTVVTSAIRDLLVACCQEIHVELLRCDRAERSGFRPPMHTLDRLAASVTLTPVHDIPGRNRTREHTPDQLARLWEQRVTGFAFPARRLARHLPGLVTVPEPDQGTGDLPDRYPSTTIFHLLDRYDSIAFVHAAATFVASFTNVRYDDLYDWCHAYLHARVLSPLATVTLLAEDGTPGKPEALAVLLRNRTNPNYRHEIAGYEIHESVAALRTLRAAFHPEATL